MSIQPGQSILNGKYRILRLIGEGGMARVWLAEEPRFGNRRVAIKEPRANLPPELRREVALRYHQEVQVCAALEQAGVRNVVQAITTELHDDDLLLILKYMPGGHLGTLLEENPGGLPIDRAIEITRDILTALDGVHGLALEVVHRDIKPANILFDDRGTAYLADFGLAQLAGMSGRSQLAGGQHPGTPMYMAPEQELSPRSLTPAADLYAVGCVLFEMLTGKRYKRVRPGTLPSSLRNEVPPWLDDVVACALTEDPWDRYQRAEEMARPLREGLRRDAEERARAQAAEEARRREEEERARAQAAEEARRREAEERAQAKTAEQARQREAKERARAEAAEEARRRQAEERARAHPIWQRIGIEMVTIPAGEFLYGDRKERIYLPEYAMSKTPVTNAQYKAFVEATGHESPEHWKEGRIPEGKKSHPVVNVNWHDATAFCEWAGCRLPTEQEWEKGARGTDGREFPWGDKWEEGRCNIKGAGIDDTTPVDRYPNGASPYGLLDMAGNVTEWCEDWHDATLKFRVLRGGSWDNIPYWLRSTNRGFMWPDAAYDSIGFRCARGSD